MQITYLFREHRSGNFSIEELFTKISAEVAKQHQVTKYYCPSASRLHNLKDVRKVSSDIYHITGDVNYLSFALPKRQTVLTVHDIGHFEMTLQGYKKSIYKQLWLNFPFKRVHKITTISQFTKERLLYHFGLPEHKVEVIHNPAPLHIFKMSPSEHLAPTPKILQIGGGRNKNIDRLIEAVKGQNVELMLLRKEDASLASKMQAYGIKYKFFPLLSYEQVYEQYKACDMVYFASNYEGFGMPILEAQAVGRPVLTSTVASMPEVAGGAAHLVDYRSVEEIRSGIQKILGDIAYRETLVQQGWNNVKKYTLDHTISKYLALYEAML